MIKLYQRLASIVDAELRCEKRGNTEWQEKHAKKIESMVKEHLPSGSGIDSGCRLSSDSTGKKLIICSAYHCMNEGGYYDGWVNFIVIVKPSLQFGIELNIVGRFSENKSAYGLKDYLFEVFDEALNREIVD